jgi:diguanylate cyclase (GGDEF)-like protein
MPGPQQNKNNSEQVFELGNLTLMSRFIEDGSGLNGPGLALQIANELQTTLDINKLIEIYSKEINGLVPHDSITFENKPYNIEVMIGTKARNHCSYQLVVAAQSLGQLRLTRKRKFTDAETELLEYLLCGLVYPLRNALTYNAALIAAARDPLTGINNRSAMNSTIIRETELARRHENPLSLLEMDIDYFKKVNDTYGHAAGDEVLKAVADVLQNCIRSSDILFRSGGEEFILVLSNTGKKGALLLAERIRKAIEKFKFHYNDDVIPVTVSIGVACYEKGDNSESLYEKADNALYQAKRAGRNCVHYVELEETC